ncbi:MAG TPA: oligosaccharide flippase family protein [Bryobacteraceae bacterium]
MGITSENPSARLASVRRKRVWTLLRSSGLSRLNGSPGLKRLAGDGVWVISGQIGTALGTLVGMRVLTGYIPPATFGTLSLLIGCVTLVSSTFCLPYLQAMLRFYPEAVREGEVGRLRHIIASALRWSIAGLAGLILIAGAVAGRVLGVSYLAFIALVGLLAVEVFRTLEMNLLSSARRQRSFAIWQALESWLRPILAVSAVVMWGSEPEAVLVGYGIGSLGLLVVFRWAVKREGTEREPKQEREDTNLARRIRSYALPLMPLAIVGWVSAVSDRYIIGGMLGLEAVGLYVAAYGIISRAFGLLWGSIELILRPIYYEAVAAENRDREKKAFRVWLGVMVGGGLLGVLAVGLFKDMLCRLLVAESYQECARLMPWIAIGYSFVVTSYVFEKVCYAHHRTSWVTVSQVMGAVASIILAIPLIYLYGLDGAAAAVPAYFAVQLATSIVAAWRVIAAVASKAGG